MKNAYSIREVSKWDEDGFIEIPALQRGLVWAPAQVELLWDSVLRGFPIGAFVVTRVKGNEKQLTQRDRRGAECFLLDGQQRYNAIKIAFTEWNSYARSVLWIDLMPPTKVSSTRRFWVKTTTRAHPWGYGNDDGCSVLGWAAYRAALKSFGYSPDDCVKNVDMAKAWPVKARCPLPLCTVFKLYEQAKFDDRSAEDTFVEKVIQWCNQHPTIGIAQRNLDMMRHEAKCICRALARLENYRIAVIELAQDALEGRDSPYAEAMREGDVTNTLEQLFTRLNTLGTPISPYDLRYSAIKAYWGDIARANDDVAGEIMPAAHLAIFAFRLSESLASDDQRFADVPSVQKIRTYDRNRENPVCKKVEELYKDDARLLRKYVAEVENALDVFKKNRDNKTGLPAVLRTSIALNSPDVYLTLLYAAARGKLSELRNPTAISLWLHWCSLESKKQVADAFKPWLDGTDSRPLGELLAKLVSSKLLISPVSTSTFGDEKVFFATRINWESFEGEAWYKVFNRFLNQKELVIYATRKYFNAAFDYDPAETKFLTGHNRPWDMDHIIPKAWVSRQGKEMGEWQNACLKWIWSIGNFAPIPFSANRSKSDSAMWDLYKTKPNKDTLFFNEVVTEVKDTEITRNGDMAKKFISWAYDRFKKMYEEIQNPLAECFQQS